MTDLTGTELAELAALEDEAADTRAQRFDGHWSRHYWHDETKQQRLATLVARRDGGTAGDPVGSVALSPAAQSQASALMRHPDYWQRPDLQARVLALCEGDDRPRPMQPVAARGATTTRGDALLHQIAAAGDDPEGAMEGFGNLSAAAQQACRAVLADPAHWRQTVRGLPERLQDELDAYWSNLERHFPREHDALMEALGVPSHSEIAPVADALECSPKQARCALLNFEALGDVPGLDRLFDAMPLGLQRAALRALGRPETLLAEGNALSQSDYAAYLRFDRSLSPTQRRALHDFFELPPPQTGGY